MRFLLPMTVICLGLALPASARPTRQQCLRACAPLIVACHEEAGAKLRYCRRTAVRICRKNGVVACQRVTTTTFVLTTTTVAPEPSTTTTTLPIDRTVNHCNRSRATDLRAESQVTIRAEGFDYAPECIRVAPGTSVTFAMQFSTFPLVGGELGVPDPDSPFGRVSDGYSATFRIFEPGVYGYYSDPWWLFRMYGAVIVDP